MRNGVAAVSFVLSLNFSSLAVAQSMFEMVDMNSPNMTEAEMTRDELISLLDAAAPGVDLTDKRFSNLDLSGVDFKQADLRWSRFNHSDLSGANLSGTRLDLAWFVDANLNGADLTGSSLFSAQLVGANLANAKLNHARVVANFTSADLSGVDFSDADLSADLKNQSMGLMRTVFVSAKLLNAKLNRTNMSHVDAEFADFTQAQLNQATLTNAKLSGANFTQSSMEGLNVAESDFNASVWKEISGLETVTGLDSALNFDKALKD